MRFVGILALSLPQRCRRSHKDSTPPRDVANAINSDDAHALSAAAGQPFTSNEIMAP